MHACTDSGYMAEYVRAVVAPNECPNTTTGPSPSADLASS